MPDLARIRNIGVAAHIDAGKTTVSERILFDSGVEHRMGDVDEGTTVLDWMPEERERGITITAAATTVPWREHAINLIDTPGHVDFTVEVERSMRVLDGVILVLDAVMGVQAQSETVWRQSRRHRVPALCFVNKLDRPGADFLRAAADFSKKLEARAVPIQYPLQGEHGLAGIVDLFTRRTWVFEGKETRSEERPIPPEADDEVGVLRADLLEALSEEDETVLRALVEGREPELDDLRRALRRRTIAGTLVPVLCGVALRNLGIQPLLDAVVDYLPAPSDLPPVRGQDPESGATFERECDPDLPLAALAFKLAARAHGDLTFVRVYSGTIEPGMQVWNPRTRKTERVARVLRMHADAGVAVDRAGPGDIVALTGLKWVATGDTLCVRSAPIVLETLVFPEPVISLVVEPSSSGDRDKLRAALERLAHEDPTFHVREDEATGQWIVSGMGELHLEVQRHRLLNEFRVQAGVGPPRVAYREALVRGGRGRGRVERTVGTKEVFGEVEVEVVPDAACITPVVEFDPGAPVPAALRRAVEETLRLDAHVGPRLGFPLTQLRIRVVGGRSDPRRDAEMAFTQAANAALREALEQGEVAIYEPLMAFEIQTPSEFASGIIADLGARSAEVHDVQSEGALRLLSGTVPLSQMFGYSTAVRSLSQGRAAFSMEPAGYRRVPDEVLAARGLVWS